VSYLQIYCEIVSDLLNPAGIAPAPTSPDAATASTTGGETLQLSIREKGGRVFVEGLSRAPVTNMQDLVNVLARGDANRATAETNMNATSSRSHAALMVSILMPEAAAVAAATAASGNGASASASSSSSKPAPGAATFRESLLVLVDLAGSERATASAGRQHLRLEEAKAINLSLSALGNCMSALAECRKHVPYRDSKLTRLLQGSLGGGARTSVMVNIAPGVDDTGEVLNALRFAARASKVKVVAKVRDVIQFIADRAASANFPFLHPSN
jgi:kinesin family protein 5